MQEQGTVELTDPQTGRLALRLADGSFVLAEQLGAEPLRPGQQLRGVFQSLGTEMLVDPRSDASHGVLIVAYGLSRAAIEEELR